LRPPVSADPALDQPLADLPLREERGPRDFALPLAAETVDRAPDFEPAGATLSARAIAFAADLAGSSLAVTLALIGAVAATGRAPHVGGLAWAAAFGLGFSFVFIALPLTLFGRTVGMSLAGLTTRPSHSGRRLTPAEAAWRWAGSAFAAAALGLPLLVTMRDPLRPTPADRWSGRTLMREVEG
jgi:hypothetical protein